jgi:hypothetical protein
MELSIEINAPVSVVWDRITDFNVMPEWNPNVTSVHMLSMQPSSKGTVIAVNRGWRQEILTITRFKLDTYLAFALKINKRTGVSEYQLEEKNSGTVLKHNYSLKGGTKIRAIFTKVRLRNELNALKRWIEKKRVAGELN